ncbi:MAG: tetratricopeptide repeat protein [Candidatus Heimdallarchaeota archaeon]|nr:tetratricopeptide repeat protein [Candidatus Heimdallarchaeota archaeon]MDH5645422.1 tetratricopeptide repeat protein [Candidatus Heimdallarchaeota archaeon]
MVEQFNLVGEFESPRLIFDGRIKELKPSSRVRIVNSTITIPIEQLYWDQNLASIRFFIICHDYEGDIFVELKKYDALFIRLGVNQLAFRSGVQFDLLFIEQQKIIDAFLNKRYLDVVITINELMDDENIALSDKDVFQLYCLQAHSLIKSGLIDKAETSLTLARNLLEKLDSKDEQENWRENFSINNPLSASNFLDAGYLNGDLIYLLYLEIINGLAIPSYDREIIIQKIDEGIRLTQDSNHDYYLEFRLLQILMKNKEISSQELNEFKLLIKEDAPIFFKQLIYGISNQDRESITTSLDLPQIEDLKGMIDEYTSNGSITRRMYHTNHSQNNLTLASNIDFIDSKICDSMGRTIDDPVYLDIIHEYFSDLPEQELKDVRKIQFLGNIGRQMFYQGVFEQALQIFLYMERKLILIPTKLKNQIIQGKIKFENVLISNKKSIDGSLITIFDIGLVYLLIGIIYFEQNSYEKSMDYLNLCQIENFNYKFREFGSVYTFKGIIEINLGNMVNAKEYFILALKYFNKVGTKNDVISIYFNLANILLAQYQLTEAENYYNLVLNYVYSIKEKDFIFLALSKLAEISAIKGDYLQSIELLQKVLKTHSDREELLIAITLFKMYLTYHRLGLIEEADDILNKLKIFDNNTNYVIISINLICKIHYMISNSNTRIISISILDDLLSSLQNKVVPDIIKYLGYITYILAILPLEELLPSMKKVYDQINQLQNKWLRSDLLRGIESYFNTKENVILKSNLILLNKELQNKLLNNIALLYEL